MARDARGQGSVGPLFDTALRLHQEGQLQQAEILYRDVLRQAPAHASALSLLGVIGCQTGNLDAGIGLIRRALALEPDNADHHNNLGQALLEKGNVPAAIAALRAAVERRPRHAEAQFNLANALRATGEQGAAEKHYRKALRARADYPDALNNLGNLLREQGALEEAAQVLRRAVRLEPARAGGHFNLALACEAQGDLAAAAAAYRTGLACAPAAVEYWLRLGRCEQRRGRLDAAAGALRRGLEVAPDHVGLLDALALVALQRGEVADARAHLERALALAPGTPGILAHLGHVHAADGARSRATHCYEAALASDPTTTEAWRGLAQACTDAEAAGALVVRVAEARASRPADAAADPDLEFALGHLHDLRGETAAAFAAYQRGNAARRRAGPRFDARAQQRHLEAIATAFDAAFFAALGPRPRASELPVFIVGLPRSGTSLVEQILASHGAVHGAGELTFFPERVAAYAEDHLPQRSVPARLAQDIVAVRAWADAYLDLLRARGGAARRVTDKMPYNFLHLGLIAALLPGARIVHCRRDPMATCFSLYTHDLAGSHPYTHDFEDLAAAYAGYERLMQHWSRVLPIPMFTVDYERLVDAPRDETRRLLEFLDLPWDTACLAPEKNPRPVLTASQWQVRDPVRADARARWRRYAEHLAPLEAALTRIRGHAGPGE